MDIRVLGSLSIHEKGRDLIPSAPKLRQLLSLLLINESRVVPTHALLTELWDESPPRSATTTLQTHILRLRVMIAEWLGYSTAVVAEEVLRTCQGGYRLTLGPDGFDLREYRSLETRGAELLRAGDLVESSYLFTRALDLWRGPALVDVRHGWLLRTAVERLEESRLNTVTLLFDAHLHMGRHREMLSGLARLAARHPLNEGLHSRFMLALHRSGDRAGALEVFARLRENMAAELGCEPSRELWHRWHAVQVCDAAVSEGPVPVR